MKRKDDTSTSPRLSPGNHAEVSTQKDALKEDLGLFMVFCDGFRWMLRGNGSC